MRIGCGCVYVLVGNSKFKQMPFLLGLNAISNIDISVTLHGNIRHRLLMRAGVLIEHT